MWRSKPFAVLLFVRWEATRAQCVCAAAFGRQVRAFNHTAALFFYLIDLYIFVRFKDLVKLRREAEDKLKAVDDVDVRVARSALRSPHNLVRTLVGKVE